MDIQSVIVSFQELEKTKNDIASAIKEKGVTSERKFSKFPSEIRSIVVNSKGTDVYRKMINNIYRNNAFALNDTDLVPFAKVEPIIEMSGYNKTVLLTALPVENITIPDGPYKSRIIQQKSLYADKLKSKVMVNAMQDFDAGVVQYNKYEFIIEPIEAEVTDATVNISYTVGGVQKTIPLYVRDKRLQTGEQPFFIEQFITFENTPEKDLKPFSNVNDWNELYVQVYGAHRYMLGGETYPGAFSYINSLNGERSVRGLLRVWSNGMSRVLDMPVYLKQVETVNFNINGGKNSCFIYVEDNNVYLYISKNNGKLATKLLVSKSPGQSKTESFIMDVINGLKNDQYATIGIGLLSDGSLPTSADFENTVFDY
jgi:hypothetical protein